MCKLSAKRTLIRTLRGKQLEATWNTLVVRTPPFNASLPRGNKNMHHACSCSFGPCRALILCPQLGVLQQGLSKDLQGIGKLQQVLLLVCHYIILHHSLCSMLARTFILAECLLDFSFYAVCLQRVFSIEYAKLAKALC